METLVSIPTMLGCLGGTIAHTIKKGLEQNVEDTIPAIRRWLTGRPGNTLAAIIAGIGVAMGIQLPTDTPLLYQVLNGVISGFTATSVVNRPSR